MTSFIALHLHCHHPLEAIACLTFAKTNNNLGGLSMKKIVLAAALLLASAAQAETTLLKCIVPNQGAATVVTGTVTLGDDASSDFLTVTLVNKGQTSQFFSQMEKGEVAEQMKQGFLQLLAMTEKTGQVDGVIVNTGFLALGQEQGSTGFGGFLAANGNIYPLSCQK
jgi:hypothetical protein